MLHMLEAMLIKFIETSLAQIQGELECPLSNPHIHFFAVLKSIHLIGIFGFL